MSDALHSRSALDGVAVPGRYGKATDRATVVLSERIDLGLATLAARNGKASLLTTAVTRAYQVDLPTGSTVAAGPNAAFIGTAPGQWFVVSEALANGALADDLIERLSGLASVTDQSDGRAVVRISGARARDVLAKGLPIDLHPRVFRVGSAATSAIGHMGVHVWQVDDAPTYDIAVFRGFAESFWQWLTMAVAEYGYLVETGRGRSSP